MNLNKDFIKGLAAGFILSLFTIYSFFRIYWLMEVGVKYLRWHAVLWLYFSLALIFFGSSYWLYKRGKLKSETAIKKYLAVLGVFLAIYFAEGFLRLTGVGSTYMENREGVFVNPAERAQKTWYMTFQQHEIRTLASGKEYAYERHYNNEGLSDKDWITEKDTNEIRVITLGDSFTEGDGAAEDSTYPRVLERMLQKEFPLAKINVMQAGRIGSDPWFEYKKLHDRLLKYKPDVVVYTNGSNDLFFDHLIYDGMERFNADSTVKNKYVQHTWMSLYEASYVFRILIKVIGYDDTFFSSADREKNKATAITDAQSISKDYSRLAQQNDFSCIQVIRADKMEFENGYYEFDLHELTKGTDTLPNYSTLDLLAYYNDSLHINKENYHEYFWKQDGHHNAKGYDAMAKTVFSVVKPAIEKK